MRLNIDERKQTDSPTDRERERERHAKSPRCERKCIDVNIFTGCRMGCSNKCLHCSNKCRHTGSIRLQRRNSGGDFRKTGTCRAFTEVTSKVKRVAHGNERRRILRAPTEGEVPTPRLGRPEDSLFGADSQGNSSPVLCGTAQKTSISRLQRNDLVVFRGQEFFSLLAGHVGEKLCNLLVVIDQKVETAVFPSWVGDSEPDSGQIVTERLLKDEARPRLVSGQHHTAVNDARDGGKARSLSRMVWR